MICENADHFGFSKLKLQIITRNSRFMVCDTESRAKTVLLTRWFGFLIYVNEVYITAHRDD